MSETKELPDCSGPWYHGPTDTWALIAEGVNSFTGMTAAYENGHVVDLAMLPRGNWQRLDPAALASARAEAEAAERDKAKLVEALQGGAGAQEKALSFNLRFMAERLRNPNQQGPCSNETLAGVAVMYADQIDAALAAAKPQE